MKESTSHTKPMHVLITGGRRVGRTVANTLAARGAHIAMTYRSDEGDIKKTLRDVASHGGKTLAIQADITQDADRKRMVKETVDAFGSLDAFVSMASIFSPTPIEDVDENDWDRFMDVHGKGTFFSALEAARVMKRHGSGTIVLFADWAVFRPYLGHAPYLISKGTVPIMTAVLAKEFAPQVRVNAIAPAMIDPPPTMTDEEINRIRALTPLKTIGTPDDAANLVAFMIYGTGFMTGETVRLDGGRFLGVDQD